MVFFVASGVLMLTHLTEIKTYVSYYAFLEQEKKKNTHFAAKENFL